jgi:hypothetical protein
MLAIGLLASTLASPVTLASTLAILVVMWGHKRLRNLQSRMGIENEVAVGSLCKWTLRIPLKILLPLMFFFQTPYGQIILGG